MTTKRISERYQSKLGRLDVLPVAPKRQRIFSTQALSMSFGGIKRDHRFGRIIA
jgi:hypothetical protein